MFRHCPQLVESQGAWLCKTNTAFCVGIPSTISPEWEPFQLVLVRKYLPRALQDNSDTCSSRTTSLGLRDSHASVGGLRVTVTIHWTAVAFGPAFVPGPIFDPVFPCFRFRETP